jgi:hypothetical protein
MLFWIRDQAYNAGFTPSLAQGQNYYRDIRMQILKACSTKNLICSPKGDGLIPPMELRWTRAFVAEAWRLGKTALVPEPRTVRAPPRSYDVSPDLARMYRDVTMTNVFTTGSQSGVASSTRGLFRMLIAMPYQFISAVLLLVALAAFGARVWSIGRGPLSALALIGIVFGSYLFVRFVALSYVAVYMGAFEPRMLFSAYAAGVLLALPFIVESFTACRRSRGIP